MMNFETRKKLKRLNRTISFDRNEPRFKEDDLANMMSPTALHVQTAQLSSHDIYTTEMANWMTNVLDLKTPLHIGNFFKRTRSTNRNSE